MSAVLAATGTKVVPGDILYRSTVNVRQQSRAAPSASPHSGPRSTEGGTGLDTSEGDDVVTGEGCYVRLFACNGTSDSSEAERVVLASRMGIAQWDGPLISVYPLSSIHTGSESTAAVDGNVERIQMVSSAGGPEMAPPSLPSNATHPVVTASVVPDAAPSSTDTSLPPGATLSTTVAPSSVFGPRPGDRVHLRVTRVTHLMGFGEIIAINGTWCGYSGLSTGAGAFRGVLRLEDIRPFRPSKEQLLPPAPSLAFTPGDVVVAEVISQSDVRQYQLSTMAESCGVVESYVGGNGTPRVKLVHLPGRRDVMMNPQDGVVWPRWCPLLKP